MQITEPVQVAAEKIERNKRKYDSVYAKSGKVVVSVLWPDPQSITQVQALENKEADFLARMSNFNMSATAVNEGFDNVPSVSFSFGSVAYLMAFAYGAPVVKGNGIVSAEPLYRDAAKAIGFQQRERIFEYGLYPVICGRIMEFQDLWPEIPIGICDNQSPIDVLTFIVHSEAAMIAMFEQKEIIHGLLHVLTNSIIELNRHLEGIIRNFKGFTAQHFNHLSAAMQISDDNAAFLSPAFYAEFARPSIERLAREFGGVNLHCCMGYGQNLEVMAHTEGFRGFDPQIGYNPIDKILQAIEGRGVWLINNAPAQKKADPAMSDERTFMYEIDRSEGKCGIVANVIGKTRDEALRLGDFVKNYAAKRNRLAE